MTQAFRFKEFSITQERTPMKVGTDGVLLGSWTSCDTAHTALDIGAGTGLLALMLAQRNPRIRVVAIEPNSGALADAAENIANSKYKNRIELVAGSLAEYQPARKFDLILSNPPFFHSALKSPDTGRSVARHGLDFDYCAFANSVALLNPSGILAGIYPVEIFEWFDAKIREKGMVAQRICTVRPTPAKPAHRVLFEYGFEAPDRVERNELIIETNGRHGYSAEYIALTRAFYLNF